MDGPRTGREGAQAWVVDLTARVGESGIGPDARLRGVLVLGGDGTHRVAAQAWPEAPLVAVSTGTNNVFPEMLEATAAGAAAGLVASGRVSLDEASRRVQRTRMTASCRSPSW